MGREEPPAALGPNPALQSLLPWRGPLPGWEGHPSCTSLVPGPAWHPACELGQLGAFRAPHHGAPSAGPACGDPSLSRSLKAFSNLSQSLDLNHSPLPSLDAFVPSSQGPDTTPRAPALHGLLTLGELDTAVLLGHWPVAAAEGAKIQARPPCLPSPGTNSDSGQQTSCCATGRWAPHLGGEGGNRLLPRGGPSCGA